MQSSGYIYCIGGSNAAGESDDSYYAELTANGLISWTPTSQYPSLTQLSTCVPYDNYIYCIGSQYMAPALYYAALTQNGIGTWLTAPYPVGVSMPSCSAE